MCLRRCQIEAILEKIQRGCGAKGGAITLVHLLRAATEAAEQLLDDGILLCIDFINAFNTRNRDSMLRNLFSHPELKPIFKLAQFGYSTSSSIVVEHTDGSCKRIVSASGARQGCILGSLLYCLDTLPLFKRAHAQATQAANRARNITTTQAYMDDLSCVTSSAGALAFLNTLNLAEVNRTKTKIIWLGAGAIPQPLHDQVRALGLDITTHSTTVMGAAIGRSNDIAFTQALLEKELARHDRVFDILDRPDAFTPRRTLTLLRVCVRSRIEYTTTVHAPRFVLPLIIFL